MVSFVTNAERFDAEGDAYALVGGHAGASDADDDIFFYSKQTRQQVPVCNVSGHASDTAMDMRRQQMTPTISQAPGGWRIVWSDARNPLNTSTTQWDNLAWTLYVALVPTVKATDQVPAPVHVGTPVIISSAVTPNFAGYRVKLGIRQTHGVPYPVGHGGLVLRLEHADDQEAQPRLGSDLDVEAYRQGHLLPARLLRRRQEVHRRGPAQGAPYPQRQPGHESRGEVSSTGLRFALLAAVTAGLLALTAAPALAADGVPVLPIDWSGTPQSQTDPAVSSGGGTAVATWEQTPWTPPAQPAFTDSTRVVAFNLTQRIAWSLHPGAYPTIPGEQVDPTVLVCGSNRVIVVYTQADRTQPGQLDEDLWIWEGDNRGHAAAGFPRLLIKGPGSSPTLQYAPSLGRVFEPRGSGHIVLAWEDTRDNGPSAPQIYLLDLSRDGDRDGVPDYKEKNFDPETAGVRVSASAAPQLHPARRLTAESGGSIGVAAAPLAASARRPAPRPSGAACRTAW